MKILAIYNIKGGVGKTATAVNLAYTAARAGYRTLIADLDPQCATTFYFRVVPKARIKSLLEGGKFLDRYIKETDYPGLDLLPADFSFRKQDAIFRTEKKASKRLKAVLGSLHDQYDLVFLDCPPNLTGLTESVFHAADALIHPTVPTTLSVRTLDQLAAFLEREALPRSKILPFFSMVEQRKSLHREILASLPESWPSLLDTRVPYAAEIERMGVSRAPAPAGSEHGRTARIYAALWSEISSTIGLEPR